MASISLRNVSKTFDDDVVAVADCSLEIADKEFIVLVGPSGCGKTTMLRLIAGLENPTEGDIYIDERLVNAVPPKDRNVAMVFQNFALYPHMTVYKNMAFALLNAKMQKKDIDQRVRAVAKVLDIEHLLGKRPKVLSGGQRQRVALGRAMVREPTSFLLDEPMSNADVKLRATMRAELIKLHKQLDATFVYVTHDQTEAMTMGDRIVVMHEGAIQQVDIPQNLYDHPSNMFVAGFIGFPQMNFVYAVLRKDAGGYHLETSGENPTVEDGEPSGDPTGEDVDTSGGDLSEEDGEAAARRVTETSRLRLPSDRGYAELSEYIDHPVVLGVRPEDIHDDPAYVAANPDSAIGVAVELHEPMGSEFHLHLKFGQTDLTARVPPTTASKTGADIRVSFDMGRIHLFDADSKAAIPYPR
jgi:multiple sugar transport system ATP-binding protein